VPEFVLAGHPHQDRSRRRIILAVDQEFGDSRDMGLPAPASPIPTQAGLRSSVDSRRTASRTLPHALISGPSN